MGVGCSDPYFAGLNGFQGDLGPKYEVNAFTGEHPSLAANPSYSGSIARRLQVSIADLNPAQNGGGLYFVEGHYVTPDDAAAGNHFNNASYRRIDIASGRWNASQADSTQREQPAIRAWQDVDPTVVESDVFILGEGMLILAAKSTDLLNGFYQYEYALANVNSDRSAGAFSIPIVDDAIVQNIGFHDVAYHSGEPFDGTDWTATRANGAITWATTPHASNPNANALRWGTLYNFRFEANLPPAAIEATIGLFKPGTPASVSASTSGPAFCVDAICDDSNPCTMDVCGNPSCVHEPIEAVCDDADDCTIEDACLAGVCSGTPIVVLYGDIAPDVRDLIVELTDLLCGVQGFADAAACPQADIAPCGGDGEIDAGDILALLDAFSGLFACPHAFPP